MVNNYTWLYFLRGSEGVRLSDPFQEKLTPCATPPKWSRRYYNSCYSPCEQFDCFPSNAVLFYALTWSHSLWPSCRKLTNSTSELSRRQYYYLLQRQDRLDFSTQRISFSTTAIRGSFNLTFLCYLYMYVAMFHNEINVNEIRFIRHIKAWIKHYNIIR